MEAQAKLNKLRVSPRKARSVVDVIRGMEVQAAMDQLDNQVKFVAGPLKKLLSSAVANWHQKVEEGKEAKKGSTMKIETIYVGAATTLKRIKPAAQGRAHRIRKRFSHITLVVQQPVASVTPIAKPASKEKKSVQSKSI